MKHSCLKIISPLFLIASVRLHAADLNWDATSAGAPTDGTGNWNLTTANWWNGTADVVWDGTTPANAVFGAGNGASGTVTVPSSTTITVSNITFNAPGSSGFNIAAASSSTSKLNLSGTTITVANGVVATNLVVFSGTSFTKLGGGTFFIKPGAANANSGPTVVGGGMLMIGNSTGRILIPGDLLITNGATAQLESAEQIADTGVVTVNGGTFDANGKSETIGGLVLDNSGQVLNASSSQAITNNGAIYDLRSGTIFPNLAGTAGLVKTTANEVVITNGGGSDTFSGPVTVSAGILTLGHSIGQFALPAVTVTITNTGLVRYGKDAQIHTNANIIVAGGTLELNAHNGTNGIIVLDNNGQILNGGNAAKILGASTNFDFRSGLCASQLGGSAGLVKTTAATVTLASDNTYPGGTLISAGILQLGDGSSTNRGQLGTGPVTNNSALVLNHSGAFTLANVISGSGTFTNLGGSPSLTGANTYTGNTIVSGGTLFVNNTSGSGTGSGNVNVQSGAGLGGSGSISGAVNIQSSASLAPGNNGISTLTIGGNLTLAAGSSSTFDVSGSTPANDSVAAGGTVNYGGTLTITPAGTFTAGQNFTLFSGAGAIHPGNFSSLNGSPGAGLAFSFTNGVLSVVSTGGTSPTLNVMQSGNTLNFSWSAAGYQLQSQTNSLGAGLSSNWFYYPGGSTSPVSVTIDPTAPTVFFRLSQ